jgi:hypothetical protein
MNEWQALRQIEYLIRLHKWTGGSTVVFAPGSVLTTVAPEESSIRTMISPLVLLKPVAGQSDPEKHSQMDLLNQGLEVLLVTLTPGDAIGHKALMGGNRPGAAIGTAYGQQSSKNRGLLEVQTELKAAIEGLNNVSGLRIVLNSQSNVGASVDEKRLYVAWRTFRYDLWCADDLFYHPCRNLAATAPGAGQVSLSWKLPPTRYDSFRAVLRRAAGATAPVSITDGTGVALSGNLATSVTDTPGAGTWSYALFFTYDETHGFNQGGGTPSEDQRVSDAVTRTVIAT